ncbi:MULTISPECIES: cyclase family protein [Gordonia]|uniref:cyclase family protein n=1 Tax=Gordonia TaxID=2053 RepID=UPI0003F87501|nr:MULTISPECIES: cyclase family protein [Gordonia]MDH3008754.1 cyclase family protein [Gordonia alkanivorans]MDH3012631.1 cyclase family protein [Gordonia alkanivorans]MDH3017677.1 cyclase family protein [Gordonia alkanivorans]MDH3025955.1 cyclase family protein [Gordonia alkanivorans]MDH3043047.1 cyclase family protein [Gordonia alkanivorans]
MRLPGDEQLDAWRPPTYTVSADGKVDGARAGTPNNWGRWGDHDQRGTANLLTADRVVEAGREIRTGKSFSLALPIGKRSPLVGSRVATIHTFTSSTVDDIVGDSSALGFQTSDDVVVMPLQGATQLDGLAHVAADDTMYNGYWAGLTTARSGARRLGIHHLANGLVGRAVLVDAGRHLQLDPYTGVVDVDGLESTLAAAGVTVEPGDILLIRTGWLGAFLSAEKSPRTRSAGLAPSTAQWLADADVALVATDTRTVEALPNPEGDAVLPLHIAALRDLGLLLGELFDLDDWARDCAEDGVYTGMFVAAPLPVVGGVGSPLNPLVLK